ncbi:hypothetical protein P154DRAFT_518275 [Amniculicola lignicola CBS 123094]|uniref:Uncharacterized protein n=1 Tax=Amniculicola lignicola CBS 123094 TaxID=1392246 RepID=A0A6A5X1W8_9PLEO|nr:hypothetical protein P154DRAFT_518275 [Amniculicola lignicola CBS 123094]
MLAVTASGPLSFILGMACRQWHIGCSLKESDAEHLSLATNECISELNVGIVDRYKSRRVYIQKLDSSSKRHSQHTLKTLERRCMVRRPWQSSPSSGACLPHASPE